MDKLKIINALRSVIDPATGQDVIIRKMIENLEITGNNVSLTLILPSLNMSGKTDLIFAIIGAIKSVYPEAETNVHSMARTAEGVTDNRVLPHVKNIIAVASGKGGVGKSTVAVNLALGLSALNARVGLIDADIYGPSIPTMLGLQGKKPQLQEVYGQMKMVPIPFENIQIISIGNIVEPEQAVVLRGPRLAAIIKQFFNDVLWSELDYLVVDLPPGTGDVQLSLVQTVAVTGVVIVTTPQEVAVIDAIKAINMFRLEQVNVPILGVVENMSWFTPDELPNHKYKIFGEGGGKKLAQMSNSMLLGQIPLTMSVRESGDKGQPILSEQKNNAVTKAFMEIAKNVAIQVAMRNEILEPTKSVKMGT